MRDDEKAAALEGTEGTSEVQAEEPIEQLKDVGEYQRTFSPKQIHVISLGGNIGSGLLIATGKALANGGPGAFIFCYGFVALMVTAVLQTLTEMTIAFPVSGNFIDYADRWVDPALAFAAGVAEWLGWVIVVGAEAIFFNVIVNYWADGSVPEAALLTIFLVAMISLFALPTKYFGYFEYMTSLLKVIGLVLILTSCVAMIAGGGPTGTPHTGKSTWGSFPAFINGFQGISNAWLLALWAMGDQIFTGILGGETKSPRYSLGRAARIVPARVCGIYFSVTIFISLLVPLNEPRLFGSSATSASPFVIALNDAGIRGLPDFMNAVLLLAVTTLAAEGVYISSRVLRTMALLGYLPRVMAKVDSEGRPRWGLAVSLLVAILTTYINLSNTGAVIFTWLSSIASSSYFMVWIIVSITSFRFRAALKAQNDPLFSQPYAWHCPGWPFPPIFLFATSLALLVGCIYIGLFPIGSKPGEQVSVYNFFQYMLGVIIVVSSYVGYKIVFKTTMRDPRTADLVTGRRELSEEELRFLEAYYDMPLWRRVASYLQVW